LSADGALLINLRRMTGVAIGVKAATATVEPGVE
jgi:FAD/FMN-containing dehydrogenase